MHNADPRLRQAFLAAAPSMVGYLEKHAGFRFRPYPHHPDYRQDMPGASLGERPWPVAMSYTILMSCCAGDTVLVAEDRPCEGAHRRGDCQQCDRS